MKISLLIKYIFKNRFNIVDLLLCALITATITLTTINFLLENVRNINWTTHIVQKGENLTSIVNKYNKDTYTLKAIAQIKQDNNMHESDIYIGQVLKVRSDI